jgi:hypothetical protein
MTDSYLNLTKAIITRLKADVDVGVIVDNRIYTDLPQNETFPYVVMNISSSPFNTKETSGMEHTIQFRIYSRTKSPKETAEARKAIYNSLHRQEGNITLVGKDISMIQFDGVADISKDNDGVTWTGIIQFSAII